MMKQWELISSAFVIAIMIFGPLQSANSIGRIGNNSRIGDNIEGYSAAIPASFPNVLSNTSDRSAQLLSAEMVNLQSAISPSFDLDDYDLMPVTMLAYPLAGYFPDLLGKNSQEMQNYLQTKFKFTTTVVRGAPCATFILGENGVGYIGVAQWDHGHGYVMTVQRTASEIGRQAILDILKTTVIDHSCK